MILVSHEYSLQLDVFYSLGIILWSLFKSSLKSEGWPFAKNPMLDEYINTYERINLES